MYIQIWKYRPVKNSFLSERKIKCLMSNTRITRSKVYKIAIWEGISILQIQSFHRKNWGQSSPDLKLHDIVETEALTFVSLSTGALLARGIRAQSFPWMVEMDILPYKKFPIQSSERPPVLVIWFWEQHLGTDCAISLLLLE